MPGHVQQEPQQAKADAPISQQHQETQQERHSGYVYKQLQECPRQGTVGDLLDWAIPMVEGGDNGGQDGHAQGVGPQADEQPRDGEEAAPCQGVSRPRRSTRVGRGQTNKYEDFVRRIGASATYAQIVSGMGGRGHSW